MDTPKNRRLLIIDDNRAIHDDFRKILGRRGAPRRDVSAIEDLLFGEAEAPVLAEAFEIDSAFQGEEGLECVRKARQAGQPYALAFIDVRMPPGWDGIETTAQIWKLEPDLQVVLCTAYSDYSWNEMMRKLDCSDRLVILKKPFDNIEVIQLAEVLAHKWELLQESRRKLTAAHQALQAESDERKQLEAALRESNSRYEELAQALQGRPRPQTEEAPGAMASADQSAAVRHGG